MQLIQVGFGAWVPQEAVMAVLPYGSKPVKELIYRLTPQGKVLDATHGRKTRAVIRMVNGDLVLSNILPETLAARCAEPDGRPARPRP